MGTLPKLGYRPHFYGPYSDAVASAVNRLKSLGFITENTVGIGAIGSSGFEIARHDFRLTEEGKLIAQKKADQNPEVWEGIRRVAKRFLEAGGIIYIRLSPVPQNNFLFSLAAE